MASIKEGGHGEIAFPLGWLTPSRFQELLSLSPYFQDKMRKLNPAGNDY
jgi:hypothetical protein